MVFDYNKKYEQTFDKILGAEGDILVIFISGVHGVGKSYFCKKLKEMAGIESYISSQLIEQKKKVSFASDKKTTDIENNQNYLLVAVEELKERNSLFVLDGHFCLWDKEGNITRISEKVFTDLKPDAIVLLVEKPEIIVERRRKRDGIEIDFNQTCKFQEAEITYAKEIAKKLNVPLKILRGTEDVQSTIAFITKWR